MCSFPAAVPEVSAFPAVGTHPCIGVGGGQGDLRWGRQTGMEHLLMASLYSGSKLCSLFQAGQEPMRSGTRRDKSIVSEWQQTIIW